jgi:hypothetical protein
MICRVLSEALTHTTCRIWHKRSREGGFNLKHREGGGAAASIAKLGTSKKEISMKLDDEL